MPRIRIGATSCCEKAETLSRIDQAMARARGEWADPSSAAAADDAPANAPADGDGGEGGDDACSDPPRDQATTPPVPARWESEQGDGDRSVFLRLQALDKRLTDRFHPGRRGAAFPPGQILAPAAAADADSAKAVDRGPAGTVRRLLRGRIIRRLKAFADWV